MILMRCIRPLQTFEGELYPGDDFAVGYRHVRINGKLTQTTKMPWISENTRTIELRKLGFAVAVEMPIVDFIQPVTHSYLQEETVTEREVDTPVTAPSIKRRRRK